MSGSDCADLDNRECVDGLYERIEALEHKLALRDAFIAGITYPKVYITDDEGNARLQTDDFGNVSIGTVNGETDRLRAEKKQIYEDTKDAVESEWAGLTDAEVEEVFTFPFHYKSFYKAIEAKLKEKNTMESKQ